MVGEFMITDELRGIGFTYKGVGAVNYQHNYFFIFELYVKNYKFTMFV